MQLAQEVSVLYSSTVPGYSRHVADIFSKLSSLTSTFQVNSKTQVLLVASPGLVHTSHAFHWLLVMTVRHLVCRLSAVKPCLDFTVPSNIDVIVACLQVPPGIKRLAQWLRLLCRFVMASSLLIRNKGRCSKHCKI